MNDCRNCANVDNEYCFACNDGNQFKPMTNADRIRSMSDEEFSHFLFGIQCAPASKPKEWLDWLKQEVDNP